MAYNTSALYKEAIEKESRVTYIDGELVTQYGTVIQIDNTVIDQGSFYVTNQCVSSDAFAYGSVFSAEAGITLKTDIDRYSLYNAHLSVFFNILLSDDTYERIPLGKFYVNEPSRIGKNVSIKAYDDMINLEKDIYEDTTGTPFELLSYICTKCDVKMAQTQSEIEALTNGKILLSVNASRVATYRDLLSYIAQITCTFAIFDRFGKLKLCEYSTSASKTIYAKERTASKFSDFETFYSSAKAFFIKDAEYSEYFHTTEGKGLVYDANEVPIIQGIDSTNQAVIDNMFSKLEKVKYTPCEITFRGDPSIDLGDTIVNVDRFGNSITSIVTFYNWTYRGSHQIKSAGQNPKLTSIKDKTQKQISNMQSDISKKDIVIYSFTNAKLVNIKSGNKLAYNSLTEVARIAFATNKETTCVVVLTIPFEMSDDGNVELFQYLDGESLEGSDVFQYCSKGMNTITFVNCFNVEAGTTYRYSVMGMTSYTESKIRVQEAQAQTQKNAIDAIITNYENIISSLKNSSSLPITSLSDTIEYDIVSEDTKIPVAKIKPYNLRAILFGQGLASTVAWDGTITIADEIIPKEISVVIDNVTDESNIIDVVETKKYKLNNNEFSDIVSNINVENVVVDVDEYFEELYVEFDVNTTNTLENE